MGRRFRVKRLELSDDLYSEAGATGPRFLRKITIANGEKLVNKGRAVQYFDEETGKSLGFQMVSTNAPLGTNKMGNGNPVESKPSSAMLTVHEGELAIGFAGASRTENMPEWAKMQRVARGLPDADCIERAKVKLAAMQPVFAVVAA
jgi:hypothetical protein